MTKKLVTCSACYGSGRRDDGTAEGAECLVCKGKGKHTSKR